jgi:hypothetical protein
VVFGKLDLIGGPVPEAPSFIYNEINDEIALIGPVEQTVSSACDRKASPPKQTKRHAASTTSTSPNLSITSAVTSPLWRSGYNLAGCESGS